MLRNFHRHLWAEKTKKRRASIPLSTEAFALIVLHFLCALLCTSHSFLVLCPCLSPHSWFSPGFYACTIFYLYTALPTALLNTSPCFALSCFHYSASPSFPFLLPLHVVFLMVLPASKPVHSPFCSPDLLCLFSLQLLVLTCSLPPQALQTMLILIHSMSQPGV